ncbi:MAG TPA: hypothetical protein H9904_07245 [Candidatus Mediterraneibacter guildfordensis]|nr:hypothetical protein [Candidatus Mediterraneibacter guildfordensis]
MGRNYVMSDIHGMSGLLKKMLDIIQPGADDRVYILGDMIDRYPYYYNTYNVLCADERLRKKIPEYVDFMKTLPLYAKVKTDGECWLLAHASTEDILHIWKRKERLIWDTSMIDRQRGIPGYVSVVGHVPTILVRGVAGRPAEIWKSPDGCLIDVDCGAVFPSAGGRLGCLCMETRQEYYVSARVCGSP